MVTRIKVIEAVEVGVVRGHHVYHVTYETHIIHVVVFV
jgi:hypothetical protein